jgi:glycosyltransferase involved in cell wall biosynthesis
VDVSVVVGTYGDKSWVDLAHERAIPSVPDGIEVIHAHAALLHVARNLGLAQVTTKYVCHLDADDELEPGYFEAMETATADLRAPCVRYVDTRRAWTAHMPRVAGHTHDCDANCLKDGNWLVVGTVARTKLLWDVGGWHDFPWSEDWDLWLRCKLAGASIERVPAAVYRAHVRPDSRNRKPDAAAKHAAHMAIARANGLVQDDDRSPAHR